MKLWLISQTQNTGYDVFDSAVVAAETEDAARNTPPGYDFGELNEWNEESMGRIWVSDPQQVTVKYLGKAARGIKPGVVLASFNAG